MRLVSFSRADKSHVLLQSAVANLAMEDTACRHVEEIRKKYIASITFMY
jgi:hypothetical protein